MKLGVYVSHLSFCQQNNILIMYSSALQKLLHGKVLISNIKQLTKTSLRMSFVFGRQHKVSQGLRATLRPVVRIKMFLYEYHIFTNKILVVHKDDPLPYYPRRSGHKAVLTATRGCRGWRARALAIVFFKAFIKLQYCGYCYRRKIYFTNLQFKCPNLQSLYLSCYSK